MTTPNGVSEPAHHSGRHFAAPEPGGVAPETRVFRPDVQGLRAVAVTLVVLLHAHISHVNGGFIGVDVFFVISGFVITGLLLRERDSGGGTHIMEFYGRRSRRIIPMATLVIVATVLAERIFVGTAAAEILADNARWAAVFLANVAHTKVNIFAPKPAPLVSFWSLAVEEQFYLVYPTLVVVVAIVGKNWSLRRKLGVVLAVVGVVSFTWSVLSSRGPGALTAYASTFTHAWELALGGLLAVGAGWQNRIPRGLGAAMTWLGLTAIVVTGLTGLTFDRSSGYPGYFAAVPALGTVLLIAGGTGVPRFGTDVLLRLPPFQWLGLWSYSLYLWHYPILIIAAQHWGPGSAGRSLILVAASVLLSAATYFGVENPIRHSRLLNRSPALSIAMGVGLIAVCLVTVTLAS